MFNLYNPQNDFYRNQLNVQNMPKFNPYGQAVNQPQFIVKQVTSLEEAKNAIIDPLGIYLFADFSTGKIYLKRMNDNGCSDFVTYLPEQNTTALAKKDPLVEINERLSNIEKKLGGEYVQSIQNDTNYAKSNTSNTTANAVANETTKPTVVSKSPVNDEREE